MVRRHFSALSTEKGFFKLWGHILSFTVQGNSAAAAAANDAASSDWILLMIGGVSLLSCAILRGAARSTDSDTGIKREKCCCWADIPDKPGKLKLPPIDAEISGNSMSEICKSGIKVSENHSKILR